MIDQVHNFIFDVHVTVRRVKFLIIKPTRCSNFSNLFLEWNYMFRTAPLSIIRSFSLYTQQWYMSYRFVDSLRAGSGCSILTLLSKPVWHIPLLCVEWKNPDDGQRNCPKHAEFHSKNKFEKLVHLVGFIVRKKHMYTYLWGKTSHLWVLKKQMVKSLEKYITSVKVLHIFVECKTRRPCKILSLLVSDSDNETFTQGTGKWMQDQHPYALCVKYCL